MVHKPKHKVHSFRGLLADGGEDEINLERQNVNLAYRIVKFQVLPNNPGSQDPEAIMQIFKVSTTPSELIDFGNPDLLAAAYYSGGSAVTSPQSVIIVFDNVLFSLNIFIGLKDDSDNESMNYHIELEEVPVGAATLMQLKLGVARKLNLSESAPDA